ncbi:MAG: matrixin family metalloprotease [Gemmatimonadaceae bacterium]|nr:matrixin family metalloprotease [Gemmatimonadaceae bacterium]
MKRSDLLPFALLLPLVGFVAVQATQSPRITAVTQAATLASDARSAARSVAAGSVEEHAPAPKLVEHAASAAPAEAPRDIGEIRRRLELGANGTYIGEILAERDSALARWTDRVDQPIRVWVGSGAGLPGWKDEFPEHVRAAFEEWSSLGIPVRFVFVPDSASADVHVSWIDHFDTPISGKTLWARDRNWWIVNGNITLALHHNGGEPLDDSAVKAIALHEVGHLLGLDHTADTANIMTARVRVRDLSEADRATMKLLYTLPPGSVK